MFWEIQSCECAVYALCSLIIYAGCLFKRIIASEILCHSFGLDSHEPSIGEFVPIYALESRSVFFIPTLVVLVLLMAASSQVIPAIIQCVAVPMIALLFWTAPENKSVHRHFYPFAIGIPHHPRSVEVSATMFLNSMPIPLIEPIVVNGIDQSILALGKWDYLVRLVQRLSHRVSFHALFHLASLKGQLRFSRYFIMAGAA